MVHAVRILVIAMKQSQPPEGTDFGKEMRIIASQIVQMGLTPKQIRSLFCKGIRRSKVKADLQALIKVLETLFVLAITAIMASEIVDGQTARHGSRKLANVI